MSVLRRLAARPPSFLPAALALLALASCGGGGGCGGTARAPEGRGEAAIPPQHFDRVVELFNRGVGQMDRYEPVEAARTFDEMVRLAPGWTRGRLNLAIALLNGQSDSSLARAEVELRRVIAVEPGDPHAHYALGMLLRQLTRFDEAQSEFERVLEADPGDADAHYQFGVLIAETDPAAAIRHLEAAVEKLPHHEAACYRLQALLRQAGDHERAREMLARFESLRAAGAGISPGMKYGEMGRYAEVLRAIDEAAPGGRPAAPGAPPAPAYTDVAAQVGLTLAGAGRAGWPAEPPATSGAFAPGVGVADVDGDGDFDLYLTGVGPRGTLFLNRGGRFSPAAETGIDGRDAIGAFFGDYDADGDPDLYLTCAGPNRLYRNRGDGRFSDVTAEAGVAGGRVISVGANWADADHDGDLDLYVANFSSLDSRNGPAAGARNVLWRNNRDGRFVDAAAGSEIDGGAASTTAAVFFDADGDLDLDLYLVNHGSGNRLFLNDRVGRYRDATDRFPDLGVRGPGLGSVLGDVNNDGRLDLLLVLGPEPPRLLLQSERGRFEADPAFAAAVSGLEGAAGGLLGDLDLDGALDVVLLDARAGGLVGHRLLMNRGAGRFAAPVALGPERSGAPEARGAVAADFDGDGSLELLVARAGSPPQLWRAPAPRGRHWLEVAPTQAAGGRGRWPDPEAVGLAIEVKTGVGFQAAAVTSSAGYLGGTPPVAHFGLGGSPRADYVRLSWPDARLQSELEVAADRVWLVTKVERKASSCPLLFSGSGDRFDFVTDFLGVGGLGFFLAPGEYAPPDRDEDVRIPPEAIAVRGGRYALRIAEPLEEATYLDQLHLVVYDHPARWEIHPDERFAGAPPWPTGRPIAIERRVAPNAARTDRGRDVLDLLRHVDRRYVAPPKDTRFAGYALDHWVELDFGDRLGELTPGGRRVLCLHGWVEYTYSHVNYAAHQAGLSLRAPSIEVPDGRGGWTPVVADAGFPAGLPRMMIRDVSGLTLDQLRRFRIRTNMDISWDQIYLAEEVEVAPGRLVRHELRPVVAELRSLGYPREYSPDGADPTLYDYQRLDHGVPFRHLEGSRTPLGDVRALLADADDRFVIIGPGQEVALEFDARSLPALAPGHTRTLVLHTEGYCKDMDLYTAYPATLEPLPRRAMENYPPPGPAHRIYAGTSARE